MGKHFILAILLSINFYAMGSAIDATLIQHLDQYEPWEGQLYHDGHLWVGSNRKGLSADYQLNVYTADGKLVASTRKINHSLRHLYPMGPGKIVSAGVGVDWNSRYATITLKNGTLQVDEITLNGSADEFAGYYNGYSYFTNIAGADDGPMRDPADFKRPARTLVQARGSSASALSSRVRCPVSPLVLKNNLFVLESQSVSSGGTDLVKVNLDNQSVTRLLPTGLSGLRDLRLAPGGGRLSMMDVTASKLRFVDIGTSKMVDEISAERAVAYDFYGRCVAIASNDKRIGFYELAPDHKKVAEWDASGGAMEKMLGIRSIQTVSENGDIYVRSAFACNPLDQNCPKDRNGVVLLWNQTAAAKSACGL